MSPVRKLFVIALTCITAKLYLNKRNVFPCISMFFVLFIMINLYFTNFACKECGKQK